MFSKFYDSHLKKWATDLCHILELIAAFFVLIAVVISLISLVPNLPEMWENRAETETFIHFLEQVFQVVIGIEFLKMLCRPTADNVLETIIFLVARHMIIVTTTTPLDDLISTVSIVMLCFVRRYLKEHRLKDKMREEEWRKLEDMDESETTR